MSNEFPDVSFMSDVDLCLLIHDVKSSVFEEDDNFLRYLQLELKQRKGENNE